MLPDGSLVVSRINQGVLQLHRFWPDTGRLEALNAYPYQAIGANSRTFADGKELLYYGTPTKARSARGLYALDLASGNSRLIVTQPNLNLETVYSNALPLATESDGRSFVAVVRAGALYRVVRAPRQGGPLETAGNNWGLRHQTGMFDIVGGHPAAEKEMVAAQ